jgi:ABC-type dipeptide/oligopeptide/nickel transport system permease subunit
MSLGIARIILHIVIIAMASTIVAFLLAIVEVRKSPPFLHQFISLLGLFPVIIMITLLLRTPGGYSAFLLMFLFVGMVRYYPKYRSRALLLQKQSYVTYSDVLGRNKASIDGWHFLPNGGRSIPRVVFTLAADLIVLRANLNFAGVWMPWDYSRALSSGEITLSAID